MDKMDLSSDFGECENGDYTVSFNAISVRGERHKRNAEHNQDCFLIGIKNQIKYAIIADGLGSCGNSHIGSKKGTELFEKMVNEHLKYDNVLSEDDVRRFNQRFIENWKNLFQEGGENYDTTLLYVVLLKNGVLVGSIGDGMILYSLKNEVVYIKARGNLFSNQTCSIASTNAINYMNGFFAPLNFIDEIPIIFILATDGVSDDLETKNLDALPVYLYEELMKHGVVKMQSLIEEWLLNWQTQNHSDDRTFCVLTLWKAGEFG